VNDGGIQYVPDDIGKVNVDEIVGKLGHVEGMFNFLHFTIGQYFLFRVQNASAFKKVRCTN
jgi:hypothetical protein